MKISGGRLRSTKRLSSAEQAIERQIRTAGRGPQEQQFQQHVRHIASKHSHRRYSNPFYQP